MTLRFVVVVVVVAAAAKFMLCNIKMSTIIRMTWIPSPWIQKGIIVYLFFLRYMFCKGWIIVK
jgi:hypothetical protein